MGLGHLPQPVIGGVGGRSQDPLSTGAVRSGLRQAELDGNRFQSPDRSQEEEGSGRVGLAAVLSVDPVDEREVGVVVV